jgi:hypothetical protein
MKKVFCGVSSSDVSSGNIHQPPFPLKNPGISSIITLSEIIRIVIWLVSDFISKLVIENL